jgi:hypothetical protein
MRANVPPPDDEQLLPTAALRQRLGNCSHMQPERLMKRDPTFPRPLYIGQRRYWRLAELRAWEAKLSREREPARSANANAGMRKAVAARKAADPTYVRG